ncbi:uncharacterized protein LOC143561217 [Bidens hawaiensis]|uniref:uncharacterized protein LOC143561217 n=1 Tax=Bidens hawaiensis TaxID=980011 RepID=UPI004049902C
MDHKAVIATVAASAGILLLLLFFLTRSYLRHRSKTPPPIPRATSLQNGISKLHQQQNMFNSNKRRANYYVLRKGLFNWSDNPSLVTDAVENGWSRFAFTNTNNNIETVEISYEVYEGSAEFIQNIRFNSGLKKAVSVVKSALPLPGPALNTMPFPQEAYFEITILSTYGDGVNVNKEGEKIKLIQENNKEKSSSESLIHVTSGNNNNANMEELKGVLTVGLAGGGWMPVKIPGTYPGSIGFNSDGSVYLEGVQLTNELESDEWGTAEKVIGCGYSPGQKKVYFTVDGKLVREVYCTTEEFETPLYPILAANGSVTVIANFGQSIFKYTQANLHRTPNPCFIGQSASSPIIGFEDSRELFSMGRIDAHWLDRSTKRSVQYFGSVNRGMADYDESSDGDLFEIVLDNNNSRGRSPSVHY